MLELSKVNTILNKWIIDTFTLGKDSFEKKKLWIFTTLVLTPPPRLLGLAGVAWAGPAHPPLAPRPVAGRADPPLAGRARAGLARAVPT